MKEQSALNLASAFLGGFSDSLDAMLAVSLRPQVNAVEECGPEMMPVWLGTYPIHAYAAAGRDAGVALLVETVTALRLLAMLEGKDDLGREELTDEDRESLSSLMGGAVSRGLEKLLEESGMTDGNLGEPEVSDRGEAGATALSTAIGNRFTAVQVTLTADPGLAFDAMVLLSESMEDWMEGPETSAAGVLSPDEMDDILRGFSTDAGTEDYATPQQERAPGNLDMVLDIRLRATARLGSIEMPLGDVLSFGPGTIIEVGRLVDEPVDLLVNNKLIARGDIVVVDEKYGLRITEIISPRERIESLR